MELLAPPVNPAATSQLHGGSSQAPRPSTTQTRPVESQEDPDDSREDSRDVELRPSLLNPQKEAIEQERQIETSQKVVGVHASAEPLGILGATIDVQA